MKRKHQIERYKPNTMVRIKLLLIALLFLATGTIYGQTNRFDVGIEGSPSLIFLRGNDFIDTKHEATIGFSAGFFFQYNFERIISLRANIAFERKGSVLTTQVADIHGNSIGKFTTHSNFNYLTLPVLVRATFGEKVQYFANAGPYLGYLIKQTFVTKGDNIPTITADNTSQDKRFDIGLTTGLGLLFPIKQKITLTFEVRNNLGLYNVSEAPIANGGTIKTNSTNFIFGFTYKLAQRTSISK